MKAIDTYSCSRGTKKKLVAILAVTALAAVVAVLLIICLKCEHEWDRDYNGICDECGEILNEVTKDVWDSEFNITNAVITTLETTESSGNEEGVEQEFYVVDGKVYSYSEDESSQSWGMDFSALLSYFAFSSSFDSFAFDENVAKYICESITVDVNGIDITYQDISVMFNASKKLASIDYFVQTADKGRINVSIWISNHGGAAVPDKQ